MINNNTRKVTKFGDNLYRIRNEKKLSREQLAWDLHLSSARLIYAYENGEKKPSVETLVLIAETLGVSLDSLFL